jgi:hypothetical protein
MKRSEFTISIILSVLVSLSLLGQVVLYKMMQNEQIKLAQTQQVVQRGQMWFDRFKQIAGYTGQVTQQTQDEGLKQLLARQNISLTPPKNAGSSSSPTPAPASNAMTPPAANPPASTITGPTP